MRIKALILVTLVCIPTGLSAQQVDNKVLGTSQGRYVFGQISDMRRDQYMLDTETGRLWVLVVDKEERLKLQPIPYISNFFDYEMPIPDPDAFVEASKRLATERLAKDVMDLPAPPDSGKAGTNGP